MQERERLSTKIALVSARKTYNSLEREFIEKQTRFFNMYKMASKVIRNLDGELHTCINEKTAHILNMSNMKNTVIDLSLDISELHVHMYELDLKMSLMRKLLADISK